MNISMGMNVLDQKQIEKAEFDKIMADHKAWLANKKQGKRASFEDIDLSEMDLSGVDLSYANLRGANLLKTKLVGADLTCTDFKGAFLHNADLSKAILEEADFTGANLNMAILNECKGNRTSFLYASMWDCKLLNATLTKSFFFLSETCDCDFTGANLEGAIFDYTDMDNAVFAGANLRNATFAFVNRAYWSDFRGADMTGTDLTGTHLDTRLLEGAEGLYRPLYCPEEGSFIAWKKCREGKVVKLLIPEHAKRTGYSLGTCKASEAVVLEIYDADGNPADEATSIVDSNFKYIKGQTATAEEKNPRYWGDVTGIHFVLSREETKEYSEQEEEDEEDE